MKLPTRLQSWLDACLPECMHECTYTMYFDICDVASGTSVFQFYCQNGKPTPSTNTFTIISSVTNIPLSWFHISLSINTNKVVTLYVNGISSGTPITLVNDFTIATLYLGRSGQYNGHSSSSIIDDLRIYNKELTRSGKVIFIIFIIVKVF